MKIREIMNKPAVICRQDDTLNVPAQLMWERDCGAIPVADGEGRLVGIITDRDICMATYTKGSTLQGIPVAEAMAGQVFSCHEGDSLETAEGLMSDKRVRRVPIVDSENRPVGMLSLSDIARHAAATRQTNGLDREVTQTLAAICQPRAQATEPSEIQAPA